MENVPEKPFITEFNDSIGKIRKLVQERQENSNQLVGLITENIATIDAKVNELKAISDSVSAKFNQLRNELESCKALSSKQQRDIDECNMAYEELKNLKLKIQEELETLKQGSQERVQALQQEIDEKEARIQDLTSQMVPLQQQLDQITRERDELKTQGEEKDKQIAGIAEKEKQIQDLTAQIQTIQSRVEEMTRDIEAKDIQIQELTTQNTSNATRIKELERNLSDVTIEEQRKGQELATLKSENDDLVSRIIEATKVINESMTLLDQLRSTKRAEDTRQLLQKFKTTTDMIQAISNSLQGIQSGGKKHRKYKKTKKNKKNKKQRGGFTYGTSSSFRRKYNKTSKSSRSSSSFNKNKNTHRKMYKKM